jgi:signal transduction histidine kinase
MSQGERTEGRAAGSEEPLRSARTSEALLTGAVAHEFKNLLLVIRGLTDLVLTRTDLERSARRDLNQIRRATVRAEDLTQRVLALVRSPTEPPRSVEPNALFRSLAAFLPRLVGEKVVLRLDLAEDLGCVCVDPLQLEQALLSLVLNARDALPHGGEIWLTTGRVEIALGTPGSPRPGRYVALRVSDDGTGMDEATLAGLFEPFFTTKEPARGTGLGLWLVRSFATEAGGEVHVRSVLGAGTTIELRLPEIDAAAASD